MEFHVTFDFGDDILYAKRDWTEEYLREFVRGFAERGISAVHMLHTFDGARLISRDGDNRYWDFLDRIPNPLAIVADECHKQGIKFIAVIKPNDRGGGLPFSPHRITRRRRLRRRGFRCLRGRARALKSTGSAPTGR